MSDNARPSAPSTTSYNPLPIPQYLFLVGGDWKPNFDFAKLLQKEEPELQIYDMRQPIYEATSILFTNGWDALEALEAQRFQDDNIPVPFTKDFLDAFTHLVEEHSSPEALGSLATARMDEPDDPAVFLNCTYSNIAPLVASDSIIACCGELQTVSKGYSYDELAPKFIWLPSPSPQERCAALRRELGAR